MARQERERKFISWYMKDTEAEGPYQVNVELGPIPAEYIQRHGIAKAAALFRPTRPRVDAVRWTPDKYILIEAKLRDIKAGIGDLTYYRTAALAAPDLPFYEGQPIVCRLVVPWMLDWLMQSAKVSGIEVVVVWYDWIADYIKEKQHYFTAEYREERAAKMKLREILGVD